MEVSLPSLLSSQREISHQWLEKVLTHRLSSEITVKSWTGKSPKIREGFLSEISFVTVSYSCGDGPDQEKAVVVKLMPEGGNAAAFVEENNLGKREIEFYKYAASESFKSFCWKAGLEHLVPEVHWAEADGNKITLVLQNLTTDGYELSVIPEGNPIDDIKCVLRSIAVVHASGVVNSTKHKLDDFGSPWVSEGFDDFIKLGIERQIKLFEGQTVTETLEALKQVTADMAVVGEKHPFIGAGTLVHGDLWTANAMFSHDKKSACIFDWQFTFVGNPLADVVTLLICSCDPDVFNDSLLDLLECYWQSFEEALRKNGKSIDVTFQEVVVNLENMWIHAFMFHSAGLPILLDHSKITEKRVRSIVIFLQQRGVFDKFLQSLH